MKILIIDDEDDIRTVVRIALTRVGGIEVVEASNGAEGVRRAREDRPDAILLDVMMPIMDGPTTLAELRSDPITARIPVIFLTSKVMQSELERLTSLGALAVLVKPFDPMRLSAEVLDLVGRISR